MEVLINNGWIAPVHLRRDHYSILDLTKEELAVLYILNYGEGSNDCEEFCKEEGLVYEQLDRISENIFHKLTEKFPDFSEIKQMLSPSDPVEKPEDLLWADEILCNACDCKNVRAKVELRWDERDGDWNLYHAGSKYPLIFFDVINEEWTFPIGVDPSKIRILSRRSEPLKIPEEKREEPIQPGDIVEIVRYRDDEQSFYRRKFPLGSRWLVKGIDEECVRIIGTDGQEYWWKFYEVKLYRRGE